MKHSSKRGITGFSVLGSELEWPRCTRKLAKNWVLLKRCLNGAVSPNPDFRYTYKATKKDKQNRCVSMRDPWRHQSLQLNTYYIRNASPVEIFFGLEQISTELKWDFAASEAFPPTNIPGISPGTWAITGQSINRLNLVKRFQNCLDPAAKKKKRKQFKACTNVYKQKRLEP